MLTYPIWPQVIFFLLGHKLVCSYPTISQFVPMSVYSYLATSRPVPIRLQVDQFLLDYKSTYYYPTCATWPQVTLFLPDHKLACSYLGMCWPILTLPWTNNSYPSFSYLATTWFVPIRPQVGLFQPSHKPAYSYSIINLSILL